MASVTTKDLIAMPFTPVPGRVVGIDPGLNVTGYAVVEPGARGPRVVEAGVIRGGRDAKALASRLATIHRGVLEVLDDVRAVLSARSLG